MELFKSLPFNCLKKKKSKIVVILTGRENYIYTYISFTFLIIKKIPPRKKTLFLYFVIKDF